MVLSSEACSAPLQVADWRRRMGLLYQRVREASDPVAGWTLWRQGRDRLFAEHPQSPLAAAARPAFAGVDYFPYDPQARFEVALEPVDGETESWDIGADGVLRPRAIARTRGLEDRYGGELTLFWLATYGGGLFLPFADATSGVETFGGGRYALDTIKSADLGMAGQRLIVDFNFACYPSCAHDAAWSCPLAPPENRLPNRVVAGERGGVTR